MYVENADNQYVFEVTPQDIYGNVVQSSEPEINLQIVWPNNNKLYKYTA